jgi:Antitoxin ParD
MSRISIDVTDVQHARLKALAALKGLSIKEFVLVSTLGEDRASDDLAALESLLDQRLARAKSDGVSRRTVGDIFRRVRKAARRKSDA